MNMETSMAMIVLYDSMGETWVMNEDLEVLANR